MIRGVLPKPPRFLSSEEVLTLHETAIDEHGGSYGLRDPGLLDSALAMPKQGFGEEFAHEVPFGMAAAYLFHICKNHPFVDGNKRTALTACVVFLNLNGWMLTASEEDAVDVVLRVSTSILDKAGLEQWISQNCRPRPSMELREFFGSVRYSVLATMFGAMTAGPQEERIATIMEAGQAIPCIHEANIGAMHADETGQSQTAGILLQQAMLLTVLYRLAEDMGYEW